MLKQQLERAVETAELQVEKMRAKIFPVSTANMDKVLDAFRKVKLGEEDFCQVTGYGYADIAREKLEKAYSLVFKGEAALVRPQIITGTHALSIALFGILRPGDLLLSATGSPYDTLQQVIGTAGYSKGSLKAWGINFEQVDMLSGKEKDLFAEVTDEPRVVFIQRSRGYQRRQSLTIKKIAELIKSIRCSFPETIILVDNCYGEFVEEREPLEAGADLIAGSLIKNPGGGIAPCGGYLVGREELIDLIAERATAPGLGKEVGPNLGLARSFFQGLFLAPHAVAEALLGCFFAAGLFSRLGFEVDPAWNACRGDIVQEITLKSPARMKAFCREIQRHSPVGSHLYPEPAPMVGYSDPVVMAAGGFAQGASLELSADAPMREPFSVYLQGGVAYQQARLALIAAAKAVLEVAE